MSDLQQRDKILESIQGKVFSRGFSKVTVDEIAQDLGMSKKTIYKFFPSKEDIMRGIMRMMMKSVEKQVTAIIESDKPFDQKFSMFFSLIARIVSRISRPMLQDIQKHMPELSREIETFRRERVFSKLGLLFHQAKEEGFLREDLNEEVFMMVFVNSIQNIVTPEVLMHQSFSAEEAFRQIFRILFKGALTPEAAPRFQFIDLSNNNL